MFRCAGSGKTYIDYSQIFIGHQRSQVKSATRLLAGALSKG